MINDIGWRPRGVTAGQAWSCLFTLTNPATGQPRTVYRCFAELGQPLPFGGYRRLVRFDDTGQPGSGGAHPAGAPANQVLLNLPETVSAGLPGCAAVLEVWIHPEQGSDPYCLLQAPFPIRAKVASLP